MSQWLPPRLVRRLIIDPLWLPLALLLGILFAIAALVGLVVLPLGRRRLFRFAALACVYLWIDVGLLLGAFSIWVRPGSARHHDELWRDRHATLLGRGLSRLMTAARRQFGYRVELVGRPVELDPSRPVIVLARHAGPGDSFTLVHLLLTGYHLRPRVVLKRALQWDPGLDVVLTRLSCYFLPSDTGSGEDRAAAVATMTDGLRGGDALLLFPEGANWTPRRHRRAVLRLLRAGRTRRAARAREQTHVLPPRPGGALAAITARTDTDVLVIAHCGLDDLVNPGQMWKAIPLVARPMRIRPWLHPAATIPREADAAHAWLEEQWAQVDQWIHTQR